MSLTIALSKLFSNYISIKRTCDIDNIVRNLAGGNVASLL